MSENKKTEKKLTPVEKRKEENKGLLLEQLRKVPIVHIACQKVGISRASFYRWRAEDPEFAEEADKAVREGVQIVNDMAESQLIAAIKNENISAIRFWLQNRHAVYRNRLEVTERVSGDKEKLTAEQEELVRKALELAGLTSNVETNDQEQEIKQPGSAGDDSPGSEAAN